MKWTHSQSKKAKAAPLFGSLFLNRFSWHYHKARQPSRRCLLSLPFLTLITSYQPTQIHEATCIQNAYLIDQHKYMLQAPNHQTQYSILLLTHNILLLLNCTVNRN
jgi:hypothetical protein